MTQRIASRGSKFSLVKVTHDIGTSLAKITDKRRHVHSPCFSPLNLPGILHLFASHLRITNYQRTCRTLLISVVPVPPCFSTSSFSFFSLSSSVSSSYKQPRINVTDVPRPKVSKYSPSSHKELISRLSSSVFIAC